MALYSVIQFTTLTILYYDINVHTNGQFLHFDLVIILPLALTMTLSSTSETLTDLRPTGRLISVPVLTSVIGHTVIQVAFQVN